MTSNLTKDCRESRFTSGSVCPYCKAERIVKHGKINGRQRFRCKSCGKTFNDFRFLPWQIQDVSGAVEMDEKTIEGESQFSCNKKFN